MVMHKYTSMKIHFVKNLTCWYLMKPSSYSFQSGALLNGVGVPSVCVLLSLDNE